MACVLYDVSCNDCDYSDHERYKPRVCKECNSENISIVTEWDEEFDHYPERPFYESEESDKGEGEE